jgi:hypothetical protein
MLTHVSALAHAATWEDWLSSHLILTEHHGRHTPHVEASRGEAGDSAGAVAALADLLTDRLRCRGPDHPNTLITRGDLAYWSDRAAASPADVE